MDESESLSISELELDDGSKALVAWLPAEPLDSLAVFAPDTTKDSNRLLVELGSFWPLLWPSIKRELETGIRDYETSQMLEPESCVGFVSRTQPNEYKSEVSDMYLRMDFGDAPFWDCFIRGATLVHFQPVF